ncbi:MAG: DUF4321 domain-containing protein [Lachnospiraceae bacterium]
MKRNGFVLLMAMLVGLILGNLLADGVGDASEFAAVLAAGTEVGFSTPVVLDLGVCVLTFGFTVQFTFLGIICMLTALFLYLAITKKA